MTVKELISELQKYDGRAATVLIHNVAERYYSEIDLICFDSEDNTCEIVVGQGQREDGDRV